MFSVSIAAARLGVCTKTIRRWDKRGLIECYRTPGNHRRIPLREIARIEHGTTQETHPSAPAVYARVSSHRQKAAGDLARQVEELCHHCPTSPRVFKDVGSGLNMQRRGLWRLLTEAKKGTITSVYITHRDRLARFGTELVEYILTIFGVTVHRLYETEDKTPQEEIVSDLMALIASFSGRVYGLRGALLRSRRTNQ